MLKKVSSALQLFVVNIALGPPLCIGLLYQKSYLITEHIQQRPLKISCLSLIEQFL